MLTSMTWAPKGKEITLYDISRDLANECGLTVLQANQMYHAMLRILKEAILSGRPVRLQGFGKFKFRLWTGRTLPATIPRSKGARTCPSKLILRFVAARDLKQAVDRMPISSVVYQKPVPRNRAQRRPERKLGISL